jgi:hypothetical protein
MMEYHTNKFSTGTVDMRIPILAEQPRLLFADWRIAIVELGLELGASYHPEHGWTTVGILQTVRFARRKMGGKVS